MDVREKSPFGGTVPAVSRLPIHSEGGPNIQGVGGTGLGDIIKCTNCLLSFSNQVFIIEIPVF